MNNSRAFAFPRQLVIYPFNLRCGLAISCCGAKRELQRFPSFLNSPCQGRVTFYSMGPEHGSQRGQHERATPVAVGTFAIQGKPYR